MRVVVVGNGRTVHALVRGAAIAALGHEVRLVTLGPVLPVRGIEVRTRPIPGTLAQALAAARGFLRDVRSFRPDILHLHYAGSRLGTMATLSGVHPMVVTVMGGDVQPEQHLSGLHPLERRATRRILEEADLILAKSDGLRPEIAAFGDFLGKVETVRWGIDPAVVHRQPAAADSLRRRLGLGGADRVVLSPRILRPLYNIHVMVEAMPALLRALPEAVLLLTEHRAEEEYRSALDARVRHLRLGDRVRFIGSVELADMPALYTLADVVVSIPFSDGLPQSLFEAMACETPTILGRLSSYAEAVSDGVHVRLVDPQPGPLAEAILELLTNPERARALAAAALLRVREIASLPEQARRVEAMYESLLARPRRRASRARLAVDALSLVLR